MLKNCPVCGAPLREELYYCGGCGRNLTDELAAERERDRKNPALQAEFARLLPAAESGDAAAQFKLARAYRYGLGVEKNSGNAQKWYERLAMRGHLEAAYELALYLQTYPYQHSKEEAAKWLLYLSENGHKEAMAWIAKLKKSWYPTDAVLQYNNGKYFENGVLVKRDLYKAREWYQIALNTRKNYSDAYDACERVEKLIKKL